MDKDYRSDYEVRKATLKAMGGDETKDYRSVYEIDLEILKLTEQGGGGIDEGKVREVVEGYEYENEAGVKEIVEGYEYKNEAGVKEIIQDENLQPKLISGENIKTVNGEDILGEGDIKIEAGEKNWYGTEEEFNELGEYDYETSYHIDGDISYNELADRPTFKTINGEGIIGSGDIEIKGGIDEGKVKEIVEGYEYQNEAGVKQIIEDENLQPKLINGENIKTVNGEDILGEGNIEIGVPTQTKQLEFELEDGTTETINFYVAQN